MDVKEETSSGVSVRGDGAPQGFYMAPRPENPVAHHQGGAPSIGGGAPSMVFPGVKKKMGRPRKYNPDGSPTAALSPMPISASIPLAGDLPGWKQPRARGIQALKKAPKPEIENLGDRLACLVGANFTPHVITVQAGEDVAMKILSVSQQESRAICVLSASGSISNVTLRQPNSSGGTLTYEGRFEILSLSGSFMPTDNGIMKSRSGGMSVSLAGPDGRVFGGGLAGLLVAATPIQVVLGSFLAGQQQQENKPKKARMESVAPVIPAVINPVPGGGYGIQKLNSTSTSTSPPTPSFQPPMNSTQFHRALEGDNNNASSDGDSDSDDFDDGDDGSPLNLEISG